MRLQAERVGVRFDGLTALSDVDLMLDSGEILGLIGPNGAGKTTLVNVLTGFQRPSAGRVLLNGRDLTGLAPHSIARTGIARTFQAARLFRRLTVLENVAVAAPGGRAAANRRARELLDFVGCGAHGDQPAGTLSYGDERRVGVARALASGPSFVLLDEPAAGLDDAEGDALIAVIRRLPAEFGCGVLVIDHNVGLILRLCQRIHVLDGGRTLAVGTPAEIRRDAAVQRAYLGQRAAAA